ncbi:uncharacterized protein LOC123031151 [Varanus komodoensis]|uniref:uncharacterized protein LOC123031151 n=1 Tax=Varanus komodoensis TaxID=61221 RepID=UPI001CF79122|nr:uncharacterized protein LOC123031151 [Varanus komodoensis]
MHLHHPQGGTPFPPEGQVPVCQNVRITEFSSAQKKQEKALACTFGSWCLPTSCLPAFLESMYIGHYCMCASPCVCTHVCQCSHTCSHMSLREMCVSGTAHVCMCHCMREWLCCRHMYVSAACMCTCVFCYMHMLVYLFLITCLCGFVCYHSECLSITAQACMRICCYLCMSVCAVVLCHIKPHACTPVVAGIHVSLSLSRDSFLPPWTAGRRSPLKAAAERGKMAHIQKVPTSYGMRENGLMLLPGTLLCFGHSAGASLMRSLKKRPFRGGCSTSVALLHQRPFCESSATSPCQKRGHAANMDSGFISKAKS